MSKKQESEQKAMLAFLEILAMGLPTEVQEWGKLVESNLKHEFAQAVSEVNTTTNIKDQTAKAAALALAAAQFSESMKTQLDTIDPNKQNLAE